MREDANAPDPSDDVLPPVWLRWSGFAFGPLAAIVVWSLTGREAESADQLSREGAVVLAVMAWMACWWLTQAVELSTTALLPLILFPLTGVTPTVREGSTPYASEIIFLFAGGCLLAMALERHGLSRRFAMALLSIAGPRPMLIVGAFMLTAALVSAFVSNTATAAMMLPLGMAAAAEAARAAPAQGQRDRLCAAFATAVLLAVAYGASIGGALTLIGSPPNAIAAQLLREAGTEVTFLSWLQFSAPTTAIFLPVAWILLTCVLLPVRRLRLGGKDGPATAPLQAPPWTRASTFTLGVFLVTVALWISMPWLPGPLPRLQDAGVAVLAGIALLAVPLSRDPSSTALSWRDAGRLPWGVFILFGGGLSLAAAMSRHGVAEWLSRAFHDLSGAPDVLVIAVVVLSVLFLTEVASNTAVAATAVPVLIALAPVLGVPMERLVIPAAFAASWAFMLPVGTPPNALVFASGRVPALTMARVGFVLNITAVIIITTIAAVLL